MESARSANFWRQAGFSLAHVSFAAGKSSGNHSLAVLRSLQPAVDEDMSQLSARIARQLPAWLTQFLQYMEAEQVQALLRYAGYSAVLSHLEHREVEAFRRANVTIDNLTDIQANSEFDLRLTVAAAAMV